MDQVCRAKWSLATTTGFDNAGPILLIDHYIHLTIIISTGYLMLTPLIDRRSEAYSLSRVAMRIESNGAAIPFFATVYFVRVVPR